MSGAVCSRDRLASARGCVAVGELGFGMGDEPWTQLLRERESYTVLVSAFLRECGPVRVSASSGSAAPSSSVPSSICGFSSGVLPNP